MNRLETLAIVAAGLIACAVTVAVTASGPDSEYVELEALARALTVGAPIAVGLYARQFAPSARFGNLLILSGFGWFMTTLSESDQAWLYSVGRVSGWLAEVGLIYMILAFPTGRLTAQVDRVLVGASALLVLCLFLPTALLVDSYPLPTPWVDCGDGCPGNAFMVVDTQPAFIDDLVRPLREFINVARSRPRTARR